MADTDAKSGGGGFLTVLLDFILGRESDPLRKDLQAAQKQLNKTGYRFYKLSKDRLLPPFASFIYGVYELVDPLREFFLKNTADKYYAHAIIEYFKTEKLEQLVYDVSEEALVERGKEMEFSELKEAAHKSFDRLTEVFSKDVASKANALYNSLVVLKQFCLVDYYIILKRFRPDLEEHKFVPGMNFGQITKRSAEDIVPDFLTAVANLLCVEDWTSQLEFISTLPGFRGFDEKNLDGLYDRLLRMNNAGVFMNFGRLLLHDPSYAATPEFPAEDIVKAYLDGLSHDMEEVLREIDTQKKNALLEQQMQEVFGDVTILELQNYTEDSSDVLESLKVELEDGKRLAYTKYLPVKYFHTLVETYLGKKLLEFIENFAVRAEIYGGDYTAKLSAEFHQMLTADDEIKKLDLELGQGFPNGYKIAMLVDAAERSSEAAQKLYVEVNSVNVQFAAQLEAGMGILKIVLHKLSDLLEDKKAINPSIVKNWSTVDEYLREPALRSLTEATSRLTNFIALMDNFA